MVVWHDDESDDKQSRSDGLSDRGDIRDVSQVERAHSTRARSYTQ